MDVNTLSRVVRELEARILKLEQDALYEKELLLASGPKVVYAEGVGPNLQKPPDPKSKR